VYIDLASVRRPQDCSSWQEVLDEAEVKWFEGSADVVELIELNDDVDVFVDPSLCAQERVDSPAAIEPYPQPTCLERIKDLQHLHREHVEVSTAPGSWIAAPAAGDTGTFELRR